MSPRYSPAWPPLTAQLKPIPLAVAKRRHESFAKPAEKADA
jgi:hypothetical protein